MHTSKTQRRLIAANIVLLAALAVVTIVGSTGLAQPTARPRGQYTLVSGRIQGTTTSGVYILDATNQEIIALKWNRSTNRFEGIGFRSVVDDGKGTQGNR